MLCDKHVVKMIVESAQMLSTAHHVHNSEFVGEVYRKSFVNHPCTRWVCETSKNYDWLFRHFMELIGQYSLRYGKVHKCSSLVPSLKHNPCVVGSLTPFVLAMPEKYVQKNVVGAYRNYYVGEKSYFAKWKLGNLPKWYVTS